MIEESGPVDSLVWEKLEPKPIDPSVWEAFLPKPKPSEPPFCSYCDAPARWWAIGGLGEDFTLFACDEHRGDLEDSKLEQTDTFPVAVVAWS